MIVLKNKTVSVSEEYLRKLCEKTFLSLWNYPNIYRDQGKVNGGDGKEVCDLLVVFGNDIIIFSDKNCVFKDSGKLSLDWHRWFRRAVEESAKQAWGAERWIRLNPQRLFLDKKCQQVFPLDLPKMDSARFHLVIIAHGVSKVCMARMDGSGSLMIRSDLRGQKKHTLPFIIGDLNKDKSFVHVLDDTTLDILLSNLDTISDFVNYLNKKETLIRSRTILAAGEEEMLAYYLMSVNKDNEHDFVLPDGYNAIGLDEGLWQKFNSSTDRKIKKEADNVSYVWDELIERFSKYALSGEQFYCFPVGIKSTEKILRFMASETRFSRRMLGGAFLSAVTKTQKNQRFIRVVKSLSKENSFYIFLYFPIKIGATENEYREVRRKYLEACCYVVKLLNKEATTIVGIATESGNENCVRSEDAVYFDASSWTEEDELRAKKLQKNLGILVKPSFYSVHIDEYPEKKFNSKNPRNKKCPCGSGKKFKKCCGK